MEDIRMFSGTIKAKFVIIKHRLRKAYLYLLCIKVIESIHFIVTRYYFDKRTG